MIVKPEHEAEVHALFHRWELTTNAIGLVTEDGLVRVRDGPEEVACLPARVLVDAPSYVREAEKPRWLSELQARDLALLPDLTDSGNDVARPSARTGQAGSRDGDITGISGQTANGALIRLLAEPEIASKRIVWRQYDHQVGTNTVVGPGSDAAVIRIKGTQKALAMATDGNGAYTYLEPYAGGAIAVAEAARNVACTGARPIAMTDCLNFGNPEKPDVYYQLREAVRGMADAARALGIPVISGNVSLYNESNGEPISPTPVAGVVGLLEDAGAGVPMGFTLAGDVALLVSGGLSDGMRAGSSTLASGSSKASSGGRRTSTWTPLPGYSASF